MSWDLWDLLGHPSIFRFLNGNPCGFVKVTSHRPRQDSPPAVLWAPLCRGIECMPPKQWLELATEAVAAVQRTLSSKVSWTNPLGVGKNTSRLPPQHRRQGHNQRRAILPAPVSSHPSPEPNTTRKIYAKPNYQAVSLVSDHPSDPTEIRPWRTHIVLGEHMDFPNFWSEMEDPQKRWTTKDDKGLVGCQSSKDVYTYIISIV